MQYSIPLRQFKYAFQKISFDLQQISNECNIYKDTEIGECILLLTLLDWMRGRETRTSARGNEQQTTI